MMLKVVTTLAGFVQPFLVGRTMVRNGSLLNVKGDVLSPGRYITNGSKAAVGDTFVQEKLKCTTCFLCHKRNLLCLLSYLDVSFLEMMYFSSTVV